MRIYHTTSRGVAAAILREGFRNGLGGYGTDTAHEGVWFSDRPLDEQSGGQAGDALTVDIPDEILTDYEWVEEGKGYREFLVPARVANVYPRTVIRDWGSS